MSEKKAPNDSNSPFYKEGKGRSYFDGQWKVSMFGGQWKVSMFGGQWKVPMFGGQWKVPMFGGQWKVPMFGGQWKVPMFGEQWKKKEKEKEKHLFTSSHFPSNKFYLNLHFFFDLKVLLYHGFRPLFMHFLSFP